MIIRMILKSQDIESDDYLLILGLHLGLPICITLPNQTSRNLFLPNLTLLYLSYNSLPYVVLPSLTSS